MAEGKGEPDALVLLPRIVTAVVEYRGCLRAQAALHCDALLICDIRISSTRVLFS